MKLMTKANIEAAFAGESQAHMKYAIYAEKAEREGFPHVARLFRAISYAERVHATNHLRFWRRSRIRQQICKRQHRGKRTR